MWLEAAVASRNWSSSRKSRRLVSSNIPNCARREAGEIHGGLFLLKAGQIAVAAD